MTNKAHYAVIAGELAPGGRVSDEQFSKIPDLIRASFQAVNRMVPEESKLKYEIIRMDEFLALSASPLHSMRSVIMLFSAFRFLSYKELETRLELRICEGIGPVEYAQDYLRESDGTAFRQASGGIKKMKRNQRISIASPHKGLNEEFSLLTTFNSPFGRFRFTRMLFELKMSQDVFQNRMDQSLEACNGCLVSMRSRRR